MIRPQTDRAIDTRIKMYARVEPETRRAFKAVASLFGETAERRLERLMREDIARNLASKTRAAAS